MSGSYAEIPANRADVIVGIQWGDEGKGRVVDRYAADYDVVARFGGGDNAGHTIVVGDAKLALRIVPSGVLQQRPELFIGGGTVVSLRGLVDELRMLETHGVDVSRVKVSDRAHIVLPYHAALDQANERLRGADAIGTTGRGIGPAYTDKVARSGIMFADLRRPESLAGKIRKTLLLREPLLARLDSSPREEDIVAGTLELGIGPRTIGAVIGVAKAYCTRVGAGPFPAELFDDVGDRLRRRGAEFGTVTGRPRRCGWFDAVAGKYATRLNGLTSVVITKLDVLSGLERVGIVTAYENGGRSTGWEALMDGTVGTHIDWYDGWSEPIEDVRQLSGLPAAARRYVEALEAALGVPIDAVSVGPERSALALGTPRESLPA